MKKSKFQINVSDLLISGGKKDEITFENESLEELENLSKDGINGTVIIQSFDNWSLLVNLKNLTCTIVEPCDKCTESYSREVFVPKYQAKFQIQIDPEDDEDESITFQNYEERGYVLKSKTKLFQGKDMKIKFLK